MKIAIVLCAVIVAAVASPSYEDNSYGKAVNTGRSQVMRKDDGHGNYEFGYDEEHHTGGTSRREKGGKGWQQGSYEIRDKDGRKRTVTYVADAHGFRAKIDTNEQGVDAKQDPADVLINSHGSLGYPQQVAYVTKAEPTISYAKAERTISYAKAEPTISYAKPQRIISYAKEEPTISYVKAQPTISYIKSEPSYGYANIESDDKSWSSGYESSKAEPTISYVKSQPTISYVKSEPTYAYANIEPQGKSYSSGYESSYNSPSYGSSYDSSDSKY